MFQLAQPPMQIGLRGAAPQGFTQAEIQFVFRILRQIRHPIGWIDPDAAGIGRSQSGDETQQCGFARAVRADKTSP